MVFDDFSVLKIYKNANKENVPFSKELPDVVLNNVTI